MLDVKLENRPGHIYAVATGEFDLDEARRAILRIAGACRAAGVDAVLIDARAIASQVNVMHRHELALTLALEKAPAHLRMAVVVSRDNMFTKALEQSATKMKIDVRTTASMAEALAFLGLQSRDEA